MADGRARNEFQNGGQRTEEMAHDNGKVPISIRPIHGLTRSERSFILEKSPVMRPVIILIWDKVNYTNSMNSYRTQTDLSPSPVVCYSHLWSQNQLLRREKDKEDPALGAGRGERRRGKGGRSMRQPGLMPARRRGHAYLRRIWRKEVNGGLTTDRSAADAKEALGRTAERA